jgi:hypothetical protein
MAYWEVSSGYAIFYEFTICLNNDEYSMWYEVLT